MKKEELKEGLKLLFDSFSKTMAKEDLESPIFAHIAKNIEYIGDAEDFNTMAVFPIERVINTFVSTQLSKGNHLGKAIYTNYGFYDAHISNLCQRMYGMACCADRSSFLLKSAINWKESGEMPEFDWDQEYTYHYPKTGSMEQWMEFIEGLHGLEYGQYERYLKALHELVQEHEEKK